jgi:predicted transposase YdaD
MGRYDITVKYFAGKYPSAYIRLALPDFVGTFRLLDKKLPQVEVEVDFWAEMQVGEETFVLHPDFQTRYDPTMPTRMHEYRVSVRRTYGKPVLSVVIWLTAAGYPGRGHNRLEEVVLGERQLVFEFREVCLWELDPAEYLARGETALLPLVPLMGQHPSAEMLGRVVETASKIENEVEQADLLTGISVLGSLRYSRELIHSLIRREKMKESPIYQEIVLEGVMQGIVQAKRDDIAKVLAERFDHVPEEVVRVIESIEETEELDRLIRVAARCVSVEEFSAQMAKANRVVGPVR